MNISQTIRGRGLGQSSAIHTSIRKRSFAGGLIFLSVKQLEPPLCPMVGFLWNKFSCSLAFAVIVVFSPISAFGQAETRDGNYLLRSCNYLVAATTDSRLADRHYVGFCDGLTNGIVTMGYAQRPLLPPGSPLLICPPEYTPSPLQLARIVIKYVNDNPEKLHFESAVLTLLAIQKAFPCPAP